MQAIILQDDAIHEIALGAGEIESVGGYFAIFAGLEGLVPRFAKCGIGPRLSREAGLPLKDA